MRVRSGCGCMTVETGSRVLASLSIVFSIIGVIIIAVVMNDPDVHEALGRACAERELRGITASCHDNQSTGIFVSGIFVLLLNIGFASLMIFGSVRRDPGYVFPYVALGFSGLVNLVIICIAFVIIAGVLLTIGWFLFSTLFIVSWTALEIYFWLIMYSHYKDLSAQKYGCQKNPNDGKVFSQPMNTYHNV